MYPANRDPPDIFLRPPATVARRPFAPQFPPPTAAAGRVRRQGNVAVCIATMKRIHDLPVRVVHGGHYPSFDGPRYRALIEDWL